MKFSVNPSVLGSMLAVPGEVAEKHLKLASGDQIKVLLAFFRFSGNDDYIEQITDATGICAADVCDCLEYWTECGILIAEGKAPSCAADTGASSASGAKPAHIVSGKPTREETVRRAAGDEELKFLFDEIQKRLSREITAAQMSTLVWLHDTYGLPVPVILMAAEYSVSEGKRNFSYIEKVCVDWAENDVTDLVSAEKRINQLYLSKSAWNIVRSAFGLDLVKPTKKQTALADKWVLEFEFKKDMLEAAYNICVDRTGKVSFPYIDKVLTEWHSGGVKTVGDIEKADKASADKSSTRKTSYDIEKIKNSFNDFDSIGW